MQVILSLLFIILSLIGMADATYLTYEKFSGIIPPCGVGFDCGAVLNSQYAYIFGIPLSVFGVLYYLTIFIFGLLHFLEIDLQKTPLSKLPFFGKFAAIDFLTFFTFLGLLFSGYLVFLMGFIIQAWCKYCLVSAATSSILFILVQLYRWLFKRKTAITIE